MIWDDLVRYISRDSAFYARLFGERIVLAARRLQHFSESGRMIPEAEDKTLREIIVQGYRIMYRLEAGRVLVPAVMHGSRDGGMAGWRPSLGMKARLGDFYCEPGPFDSHYYF